jgi:hypothetical protein
MRIPPHPHDVGITLYREPSLDIAARSGTAGLCASRRATRVNGNFRWSRSSA